MKILFRNLNRQTTEKTLKKVCMPFGIVQSATLVTDAATKKSKGFGFVEMESEIDGQKVIKALNEAVIDGSKVRVKDAEPKESEEL